jgi:nucleoside-diphosphate-sugar epimerase
VKIAIVGANGQVGAELCLLLAAHAAVQLVPVCRTRSGSAFLRWQGIACRHGRISDPAHAARLIGDCDLIVNSSLASGSPAEIRRTEDRIVDHIFAYSKPRAVIIHFSTQSVYGDPRPGRWIRWRNPYGRAKLGTERRVRSNQHRHGKRAYILRLGHVCGALQGMSEDIRTQLRANRVLLPRENHSSNTVYTQAIVAAILQIARGGVAPQTYDLMNSPPWGWHDVYAYEAKLGEHAFAPRIAESARTRRTINLVGAALRVGASLAAQPAVRDFAAKLFAYAPDRLNARTLAWWYKRRARTEIAALNTAGQPAAHLSWVKNGKYFFPAELPTAAVLEVAARERAPPARAAWPDDLPDAEPARAMDAAQSSV